MTQAQTVIVGAGIAGLACATELVEHGEEVMLLEARARVGGAAETCRQDGFLLERGPNTVRSTPELEQLIRQTGLEVLEARPGSPYLVAQGRLVRLPPALRDLGAILPPRGWLQLLGEPFRTGAPGPRTVHEFVRQRFGATVAEHLADLMTLGVFGAASDRIGFESAFPDLAERLLKHRSVLHSALAGVGRRKSDKPKTRLISTPEGLGPLTEKLAKQLGPRVRRSAPVHHIECGPHGFELQIGPEGTERLSAQRLVLTLAPELLADRLHEPRVQRLLRGYRSAPQALASFALDDPACAERWTGFGFLAPTREQLPMAGCLFPSSLFENRAPRGTLLLVVFVGPDLVRASEATISAEIAPRLEHLLGARKPPVLIDVARHPVGITLYDRRHRDRTRVLRNQFEKMRGPWLAGAAYDGVAFGAAAASGVRTAQRLLERSQDQP